MKEKITYEISDRKNETTPETNKEKAMEAFSTKKLHVVEIKEAFPYTANSKITVIVATHMKSINDFS